MSKEKLIEIKKGQEGTGLLIENDGYISSSCGNNKQLFEDINAHGDGNGMVCPEHFIVSAVFQKFDIENANGRIYPERILKREVERYMAKIGGGQFGEKRAIGECYTSRALVLSASGWKPIAEIKEGDDVLTLNTETNEIEIQKVTKKIEYQYDGEMYHLKGRNIDDIVTPNHGYPIYDRYGKFNDFYTAEEIYNGEVKDLAHSFIPKQGNWNIKGDDYFVLKGIYDAKKSLIKYHPDVKEDKNIPMKTFMKFLGIYLAEGDYRKNNNDVNIYQKKETTSDEIFELLIELGLNYTIYTRKDKCKVFRINDPRLHKFVSELGNCYTKHIPQVFKNQSKENLRVLYDWFVKGDGRTRGDKRRKSGNLSDDVFSSSRQLILDLNEIQLKIGYSGNFSCDERNYDRPIENRTILAKNSSPLFFTLRSLTKGIYLDKRFLSIEKKYYAGEVMCLEVPNHTFYVMDGNKCHWSKNCNHPDDTTIDLSRVALNIIELHWEGHTLVGKLEILTSPGYRKYGIISCQGDQVANLLLQGIKIGVSSRGLGSVTNKMGTLYVGDDFEIVCWDFVSDPSTPNAFVSDKEEVIQRYVEEKETAKPVLSEKIEKAMEILKDF